MNSLKDLRDLVKNINKNLTVKTNGDMDLFNKKLYAIFSGHNKLTPFYSVKEWNGFKLISVDIEFNDKKNPDVVPDYIERGLSDID
jgi:plasmid rolling circle replication initiator protein Rep